MTYTELCRLLTTCLLLVTTVTWYSFIGRQLVLKVRPSRWAVMLALLGTTASLSLLSNAWGFGMISGTLELFAACLFTWATVITLLASRRKKD